MAGSNVTILQLPTTVTMVTGDSLPLWSATGASTNQAFATQVAKMVYGVTATGITVASGGAISSTGNFTLGAGTALATTATLGYVMIGSCAGTPTGVPVGFGVGNMPIVYDTTNNKLWVYAATGAWRGVSLT